ncbi:MAG: hypothetical protein DSZ03_08070 [Sulfurimonas sp.]|nr:MAG: hypothetical protein DSZ03_08070 [Sulfurimonas sp.]
MKKDVVLPSLYRKRFEALAKEYDVDFEDEAFLAKNSEETIQKANDLLDSTHTHITRLSNSTQDAQDAIRAGDDQKLQRVSHEVAKLQDEMKQLQARIYTDPLTEKYNRQWISDNILDSEGKFKDGGALTFIDLDRFKFINDHYGHTVGDKVLIYIANFLEKSFESSQLVRFAGDEFIVFSSVQDIPKLTAHFRHASDDLTHKKIRATNGDILPMGFSFGIAAYNKGDAFKTTIEQADQRMYADKEAKKASRS